ncbi:MAG: nucleotidyltransferase substrate binding protein [Oceanobacter sp.]
MYAMNLDLSPLTRALNSLDRAVSRSLREPEDEEVRDSVIQRFEYTYELCWKMLKRQLEMDSASPAEVDSLSFRDLIRSGAERGYIQDPSAWFVFREMRNITSHTYNAEKAKKVHRSAIEFAEHARSLLEKLAT